MQFERIRKNHKRKIIIGGILLVCVVSAITITTTRAKYKLTEDIPLVRGYINYIADREKPTITNVTTSVTKTEINVTVSASDNIGVTEYWYQINSNTPIKQTTNTYKFTGLSTGTSYTIKVYVKDAKGNQSDTTTKSVTTAVPTSEDTLAKLNITVKTGTPDFSQAATTDEGVYKVSDPVYGGTSYYWRGAVTNNYVKFGGFCWRIIRINGDGSMRLIYGGSICDANGAVTTNSLAVTKQIYNTSDALSYHVGWTYSSAQRPSTANPQTGGTSSNAKTQLESWYNSNIGNNSTYSSKIADGKYCNDRNVGQPLSSDSGYVTTWSVNGTSFRYVGAKRLWENYAPTLRCSNGDIYSLKVGLITADEVEFAGGVLGTNNKSYYLYNGMNYWTMSPNSWWCDSSAGCNTLVFAVNSSGWLATYRVNLTSHFRPVINLRFDVTFSSGNGTQSNPYMVQ